MEESRAEFRRNACRSSPPADGSKRSPRCRQAQRRSSAGHAPREARQQESGWPAFQRRAPSAAEFRLARWPASSFMRGRNSLGTAPIRSPKKSLICVDAIRMAMPLVNPMTTGRGMKRTAEPRPVSPMASRMMPAMSVTMARPLNAEAGHNARHDHDKCAGRSADLRARAAQSGNQKSGHNCRVKAGLRRDPGGNAEGHGQRQRDQPHRDPGEAGRAGTSALV